MSQFTSRNQETRNETSLPQLLVREFYFNSIQVNVSAFEVELSAMLVSSKNEFKGGLNLRLSPQTAVLLRKILTEQMAGYEKQFGPIPLPKT